jgi:hypothetical protein
MTNFKFPIHFAMPASSALDHVLVAFLDAPMPESLSVLRQEEIPPRPSIFKVLDEKCYVLPDEKGLMAVLLMLSVFSPGHRNEHSSHPYQIG